MGLWCQIILATIQDRRAEAFRSAEAVMVVLALSSFDSDVIRLSCFLDQGTDFQEFLHCCQRAEFVTW